MDYKKTLKKYIYERDGKRCSFCEKELLFRQISLDHYLPKSHNGPNDVFNIVLSCKKCNKHKKNSIPNDYETIMIRNLKQGIIDKKISASGIKYKDLIDKTKDIERIESINEFVVFQSKKYRFYNKKNHIDKIIELGTDIDDIRY